MRRMLTGLLAVVLIATGSTLVASPAEAAAKKPVTITKLNTQWIGWKGVATVKPKFTKAKGVKITRKTLTVRQGGKVIRKNRTAVNLRPGTYKLTTKVAYKHQGKKKTATRTQKLVVKQGRCAVRADYQKIKPSKTLGAGTSRADAKRILRSAGTNVGPFLDLVTVGDWHELAQEQGDAEGIAYFDDLVAAYGAEAKLDLVMYNACKVKTKTVDVVFIEGHAIEKHLE